MRGSTYDKSPAVAVPGGEGACSVGWDAIASELRRAAFAIPLRRRVIVVDCYVGVFEAEVMRELSARLKPALAVGADALLYDNGTMDRLVAPFLGGSDPVFGYLSDLGLEAFLDPDRCRIERDRIERITDGLVLVVGCGARHVHPGDVLVYADLARWEAQQRFRRGHAARLGGTAPRGGASEIYKRSYFVDWRVCDRWKRRQMADWDYVLDTHESKAPKLVTGEALRRGLRHVVSRPFRVVPFFDPAPWGGRWMKEVCALDRGAPNYGWGFDCVPEENSLLLKFGSVRIEVPSIDLVLAQPRALLGDAVRARFGDEFPIRFDLLDTMGGGPLSFQVHPMTEYIREHFGMRYTQDESYYLLDAGPDASVVLGLREGVESGVMGDALREARDGGRPFEASRFANTWPARKHDHFLIPAGTPHCSGANAVVLEISATPYLFTFKMWDWGRAGLDGKPRPIHLDHALANIQWDRTTDWVRRELVNRTESVAAGEGWREERTGLHPTQFIESRRHWFTGTVPHDTEGGVQVLNLVEGGEAVVESPEGKFEPFVVHYAETFIVPAAVGQYTVRPIGLPAGGREWATVRASVRKEAL